MAYAFDGAGPFDLAAAKAKGGIVCTVYIVGHPGGMQPADKARVDAIRAEGMGALPNWERAADYFLNCTLGDALAAGVEGRLACQGLGFPGDGSVALPFSFDFDVPAGRYPEMGQKVAAIASGLAGSQIMMIYGQESLIVYLLTHGFLKGKQWLMMSTFGQPYTPRSTNYCMVQGHDLDGNWIQKDAVTDTDINTVTDAHAIHAWWPPGSPYATGGTDMTPAESKMLTDLHDRLAKFDIEAFQISTQAVPAIAAIRAMEQSLGTSVADVKAAVVALAAAVAKLQAGGGGVTGPATVAPTYTSGPITLTPTTP